MCENIWYVFRPPCTSYRKGCLCCKEDENDEDDEQAEYLLTEQELKKYGCCKQMRLRIYYIYIYIYACVYSFKQGIYKCMCYPINWLIWMFMIGLLLSSEDFRYVLLVGLELIFSHILVCNWSCIYKYPFG